MNLATMNETATNKQSEILHPEVWTLSLHLHKSCLKYAMYSRVEDNSLTFGTIDFAGTADRYVKEVETAIYDNPFFLSQFGSVSAMVDSDRFLIVPDEMAAGDENACRRYYDFIYPDDHRIVASDSIPEAKATIVFGIEPELDSFLRRTFDNPPVCHCLSPMVRFFMQKDAYGARNKMYVFFNNGTVEIIALKNSALAFANFFLAEMPDDAFYFVMNAWTRCAFDAQTDEIYVVGDREMKAELLPRLRQYVKNVMQMVFPADLLKLGKDVMTAPFDLIILPLCE